MLNSGLESDCGGCRYAVDLGTTVGGMVGVRVLLTVAAAGHHFLGDIDMRLWPCSYQLSSWARWRQWRGSSMKRHDLCCCQWSFASVVLELVASPPMIQTPIFRCNRVTPLTTARTVEFCTCMSSRASSSCATHLGPPRTQVLKDCHCLVSPDPSLPVAGRTDGATSQLRRASGGHMSGCPQSRIRQRSPVHI